MSKPLQGIDTVIVRVSSLEKSKKWYHEKLALTSIWEDDKLKLAVLDTGGPTSLTLWATESSISIDSNTASYPIFKTKNAAEAREALLSKGVTTGDLVQDPVVSYFWFYDPDGNVLEACQVYQ